MAHSRPEQRVWFEHLANEDMMYVRVTSFLTEPAAPQRQVWREMREELEALGIPKSIKWKYMYRWFDAYGIIQ